MYEVITHAKTIVRLNAKAFVIYNGKDRVTIIHDLPEHNIFVIRMGQRFEYICFLYTG